MEIPTLYLRMDPQTWKIVGIEIPELSLRLNDDPGLLRLWMAAIRLAGPNGAVAGEVEPAPTQRLGHDLREFLVA